MAAVAIFSISPSSSAAAAAAAADIKSKLVLRPPSLCLPPPPSSSASISLSLPRSFSPSLLFRYGCKRATFLSALVEEEQVATAGEAEEADEEEKAAGENGRSGEFKLQVRPCELYVCNLPRSCDISDLDELFKPFGTVQSVEVSRNIETGVSKGCGYVTMSSLAEARAAIAALDGSDLGGREIRVKFSVDMVSGRKNIAALNTAPKKDIVFESPYKAYVGNLVWSVSPEDLREYFSQFGTVVSTRLLHDRKGGKNRVYGFLSFSSADELKAAVSLSGTEFHGRTMLVREIVKK